MLIALTVLVWWSKRSARDDRMADEFQAQAATEIAFPRALGWTIIGMLLLLLGSRLLVSGAVSIATSLGVSELIIGLTIVAVGTSLPELAASVASALRGEAEIAIGNVIGSNMFNMLAVLCLPGLIHPHVIEPAVLDRDYPVMFMLSVVMLVMSFGFRRPGRINRWEGAALLVGFLVYEYVLYLSSVSTV